MKKNFLLILFFIISICNAQSQLKFDLDYAKFSYDSTSVYAEFYYELRIDGMKVIKTTNDQLMVEAIVQISIRNTVTDSFFVNKKWKLQQVINPNDSTQAGSSLAGVLGFQIPKGVYQLTVVANDSQNPELKRIITEKLIVEPFNNKPSISDIELARNIKTDGVDNNSIFYKNTLEVMPNSQAVFDANSPALFFYSELYGLQLSNPQSEFTLTRTVNNSKGTVVHTNTKTVKHSPNSVVEIGIVNLSKLPTDSYELSLSITDPITKRGYKSSKKFFLYNPKIQDNTINVSMNSGVLTSEFALMTSEECDELFNQLKYISTPAEIERYSRIDSLKMKQDFLYRFWQTRDSDPSTERNEAKEDYMRRVQYANEHFKVNKKPGYLTDRGRVLLVYGEPDSKDYYSNESNMKPYEIWSYHQIEGGVTFIFGDPTGFGNFELLTSTKYGEYRDDNWQQRLKTY